MIDRNQYIKECPKIKTTIHWYDMPDIKVVKLSPNYQERIMKDLIGKNSKYGLKQRLSKRLGVPRNQLNYWLRLQSNFSVGSLKKICQQSGISINEMEKHIIGFGRKRMIMNPKFPFKMSSKEGIMLRSIINSEGHISESVGRSVMVRVPEIDMLETVVKISKKLFGDFDVGIKKTKDKNTHEVFIPGEIGDVLVMSGLTRGRKSVKNPLVPKDIMIGPLWKKRIYLQWSMCGEMECTRNSKVLKITRNVNVSNILGNKFVERIKEGATFKKDIPKKELNKLYKHPPKLLIGEKFLFEEFGIFREPYPCNIWKYKNGGTSSGWSLPITNKKEIGIVYWKIGLPLSEKRKKVKQVIDSYVR